MIPAATQMTPGLKVRDADAAYWVGRAILSLRREMCWCWRLRDTGVERGSLPPVLDPGAENLDVIRYEAEKPRFFETDPAAGYLSEQIARLERPQSTHGPRGSWAWVARELSLDDAAQFLMGLVVAHQLDASVGPAMGTCLNDRTRPFPTLALAQRLWDGPAEVTPLADSAHPLFRMRLVLAADGTAAPVWMTPLAMYPAVAALLADASSRLPHGLRIIEGRSGRLLDESARMLAARLRANPPRSMEVVPVFGSKGSRYQDWAASISAETGRRAVAADAAEAGADVVAWLRDLDLVVRTPEQCAGGGLGVPVRWYVPVSDDEQLRSLPQAATAPAVHIPALTFEERAGRFREGLGEAAAGLDTAIEECSRRFRFQEEAIDRIARTLRSTPGRLDLPALIAACRNEASAPLHGLAQAVTPRFGAADLVLPVRQRQQFTEILHAMRALTEVHYHWGTARVWNEGGIAVLFSGVPGTGKTMAAEALATELSLPMYRIDLSQVVNKYIGETEKNLKRVFDAAELSDCILFFDEAYALFGKRTEVRDAHDRFANIEVSYLLERMERFKGLAILATNRRKDIDEAFLRRLRYVVEFPQPGVGERELIWRQAFPRGADTSGLDFGFLARQFTLTGGNIRSIAFAACLQSAGGTQRKVTLDTVLVAVKRELEKMNRAAGDAVFGSHGEVVREKTS